MSTQPLTDARVVVLWCFVGLLCSLDFGYFNAISVLFNIVNCGKKKVGNYGLMGSSIIAEKTRLDASITHKILFGKNLFYINTLL